MIGVGSLPQQPMPPGAHQPQQQQAATERLFAAAASGQKEVAMSLVKNEGADVNATDSNGLTPVIMAVLGGHLNTAVQLALAGADLSRGDQHGHTALEHAIAASNREMSLALLLIATTKFTKPLHPILTPTLLHRLQFWVLDKHGKNDKAAAVVLQQQRYHLVSGAEAASPEDRVQLMQGFVTMCVWAAKHGHASHSEQVTWCFANELPQKLHTSLPALLRAEDGEGHNVLHAMVLAGQAQACRTLALSLPPADALALLRKRNAAGMLPSELRAAPEGRDNALVCAPECNFRPLSPPTLPLPCLPVSCPHGSRRTLCVAPLQPAIMAAAHEAARLAGELAPSAAGGATGGAVRRRKSNESSGEGWPLSDTADGSASPSSLSDGGKAAAAAGNLLQLAAAASGMSAGTVPAAPQPSAARRGGVNAASSARARDVKPYQRPGTGTRGRGGRGGDAKGGTDKDCWLPGGFWWKDGQTAMPPGRQPGELAGWAPLAGERAQQLMQEQKKALSQQEQHVAGIESRDDAVAYLQQLQRLPSERDGGGAPAGAITSTVDDSVIEHSTAWKQLASWGGFRRHYKAEETQPSSGDVCASAPGHQASADISMADAPAAAPLGAVLAPRASLAPELVQAQLAMKRREVDEARRRLEDLLQAQQQLERLLLPEN
mmetsp:Transcript_69771/g.191446  ORF Transcript_69771/g.191446 Transcript_69771/m.191446 type:complete len:662 (+) Transcript_69771:80-2065(+)